MQFQDIVEWMLSLSRNYGYLGIFIISLVGAASIFVPIPYTVVIFTLGGLKLNGSWVFEPVWIAVAAGVGSAFGEFSSYMLGFGGRKAIGKRFKKKMDVITKVFNKSGPLLIFVFALTPLPDDLLFIPLGVMRYNLVRAFIPALIGKFLMNLTVAYGGRFSVGIIRDVFGVESDWVSTAIGLILAIVLLAIVLVVIFKLDWEKHLEKYVTEKKDSAERHESNC